MSITTLTIDLNDSRSRAIGREVLALFDDNDKPSRAKPESKPTRAQSARQDAVSVSEPSNAAPWEDDTTAESKPAATTSARPAAPDRPQAARNAASVPAPDPDDDPWS